MNHTHTKTIWLLLLREGGLWTPKEICEALPDIELAHAGRTVSNMLRAGYIKAYPIRPGGHNRYGITGDCEHPRGLQVKDWVSLGLVRVEPEPTP